MTRKQIEIEISYLQRDNQQICEEGLSSLLFWRGKFNENCTKIEQLRKELK